MKSSCRLISSFSLSLSQKDPKMRQNGFLWEFSVRRRMSYFWTTQEKVSTLKKQTLQHSYPMMICLLDVWTNKWKNILTLISTSQPIALTNNILREWAQKERNIGKGRYVQVTELIGDTAILFYVFYHG